MPMGFTLDPQWHMWVTIVAMVVVLIAFAWERISLEISSLALLAFLLLWFQLCPLIDPADGQNRLDADALLAGFANPSLLAVLALLVMGQAMVQTGALTGLTRFFVGLSKERRFLAIGLARGRILHQPMLRSGLSVLFTGGAAAAVAYGVGAILRGTFGVS